MSEKFRLDRKIGFQNTFYTKCINVITDSIGPSIILRSILISLLVIFQFRLFVDTLLSPAGKGLASWPSFVMSNCKVVTFPLYPGPDLVPLTLHSKSQ